MRWPNACIATQLSSSSATCILSSMLGKPHNGCSHLLLHIA
jgi:hypothetical protein